MVGIVPMFQCTPSERIRRLSSPPHALGEPAPSESTGVPLALVWEPRSCQGGRGVRQIESRARQIDLYAAQSAYCRLRCSPRSAVQHLSEAAGRSSRGSPLAEVADQMDGRNHPWPPLGVVGGRRRSICKHPKLKNLAERPSTLAPVHRQHPGSAPNAEPLRLCLVARRSRVPLACFLARAQRHHGYAHDPSQRRALETATITRGTAHAERGTQVARGAGCRPHGSSETSGGPT